jgi:pimeloyl-ACP methyl ester carboxylesterase
MRRRRARAASDRMSDATSVSAHFESSSKHLAFDLCSALAAAASVFLLAFRVEEWWARFLSGVAVGAALFVALRALPALGAAELDAAEDAVIATIRDDAGRAVDVKKVWTEFSSTHVRAWKVHALHVRARPSRSCDLPPLVLVHGHSSGAAHWDAVLGAAATAGCEAWAISLPGWGRTPMPTELLECGAHDGDSADLVAEMIDAFLSERGLSGRAVLLGHSFGGFITTRVALKFPRAISHLILHSSAGLTPLQTGKNGLGACLVAYYFSFLPPQAWVRICGRVFAVVFAQCFRALYPHDNPAFPAYYAQLAFASAFGMPAGGGSELVRGQLRVRLTGGWWRRPTLPQLIIGAAQEDADQTLPISVIWGTRDEINDASLVRLLHRHRPNVNVYWISRGLHNCSHSHPALFNEVLFHSVRMRIAEAAACSGNAAILSPRASLRTRRRLGLSPITAILLLSSTDLPRLPHLLFPFSERFRRASPASPVQDSPRRSSTRVRRLGRFGSGRTRGARGCCC